MAVEPGMLDSALKTICKQLWRAEPGAIAAAKKFFHQSQDVDGSGFRHLAREALLTRMDSPAVAQAMVSLRAGESPSWFARFKPQGRVAPQ
jgi:hypothetical protein